MAALTREQSREIDRIASEEMGIPGIVLMENAARGVAEVVAGILGAARGVVAIVCGPGNNGGDGLACARHLDNRGYDVVLHLAVPTDAYREGSDAAVNLAIVRSMGVPLREGTEGLSDAAVVVDALFGTGLVREVRDPYRGAIRAMNGAGRPIVAVDVPSGLDANTGQVLGEAVVATATATMVAPKVGFALNEGPAHVGRIVVVDIGMPRAVLRRVLGTG